MWLNVDQPSLIKYEGKTQEEGDGEEIILVKRWQGTRVHTMTRDGIGARMPTQGGAADSR